MVRYGAAPLTIVLPTPRAIPSSSAGYRDQLHISSLQAYATPLVAREGAIRLRLRSCGRARSLQGEGAGLAGIDRVVVTSSSSVLHSARAPAHPVPYACGGRGSHI